MERAHDDRVRWARIAAAAARWTRNGDLTGQAGSDAWLSCPTLRRARSNLLAEYAGIAVGFHEGYVDEGQYLRAAQLCIEAGADTGLIPHWLEVGRRSAREHGSSRLAARRPDARPASRRRAGRRWRVRMRERAAWIAGPVICVLRGERVQRPRLGRLATGASSRKTPCPSDRPGHKPAYRTGLENVETRTASCSCECGGHQVPAAGGMEADATRCGCVSPVAGHTQDRQVRSWPTEGITAGQGARQLRPAVCKPVSSGLPWLGRNICGRLISCSYDRRSVNPSAQVYLGWDATSAGG
jgi:hypothetical protein